MRITCPDNDIEIRYRHALFNVGLNATWLAPMQHQLTHLTLHATTFWGVYPLWPLHNLHFPKLKSLALGNWTIAFDWQIDFITSHGKTLEQLVLTNCPILHASRMTRRQSNNDWQTRLPGTSRGPPPTTTSFPDLRWHTVLPAFGSSLTKLKHFSMGRGPVTDQDYYDRAFKYDEAFEDRYSLAPRIDSSRYAIFDYGNGPAEWIDADPERGMRYSVSCWEDPFWLERETDEDVKKKIEYPDCLQEDQEALEGLLRILRERW